MKMIDFTPLVTMGYKKVLTRLAIASFAVALAVKMAGLSGAGFRACFRRCSWAIGYVDYVCGDSAFTAAGRARSGA